MRYTYAYKYIWRKHIYIFHIIRICLTCKLHVYVYKMYAYKIDIVYIAITSYFNRII